MMQEITGCLSGGAHPGGLNGQDALNGMLVNEYESMGYRERTGEQHLSGRFMRGVDVRSRSAEYYDRERESGMSDIDTITIGNDKDGFHTFDVRDIPAERCVRRLTEIEYNRLQGLPDNWDNVGNWVDSKGKRRKHSGSSMYKEMGNSIAIPAWIDILQRVADKLREHGVKHPALGSLFDGVGGFPLIWETMCGGNARWASEIDEHCVAVTKKRFGDEDEGIEGDLWEFFVEGREPNGSLD